MLDVLLNKKLLMPFIILIVVFAALTFNYYRGYAAGTEAQKLIYERQFREMKKNTSINFCRWKMHRIRL